MTTLATESRMTARPDRRRARRRRPDDTPPLTARLAPAVAHRSGAGSPYVNALWLRWIQAHYEVVSQQRAPQFRRGAPIAVAAMKRTASPGT